jgi:hypothetical protein
MLRAARLVDDEGNAVPQVRAAYRATATKGEHTAADLVFAEIRLVDAGLLVQDAGQLVPDARLTAIVRADDSLALILLRRTLVELSPAEVAIARALVGERGEEHVVRQCRDELEAMGRLDLSRQVQRVSLVSDSLGYDVWAPSIGTPARHLEVKTSSGQAVGSFEFYISRNEFEVGRRESTAWALVACQADGESVTVGGWCRAAALGAYLPDDQNGFWTEARVRLPRAVLAAGLPPAL